ncbi:MAG: acetyl/propionyl/methylcrotonyl-CoA carboxylase subunit alpha [Planctomycetota bacterium]
MKNQPALRAHGKNLRKVLVANRGEIAIRVFQCCRENGIATVAVYSEADAHAPHRYAADESVLIGGPAARDSYLRAEAVIEAARVSGADAVHPGYGFLSENAGFARAVEAAGLTFIGPTPLNIEQMGDKSMARRLMQAAGVPVVPGTEAPIGDEADLIAQAKRIGYPLLVKAVGGGGGKGIRRVANESELLAGFRRSSSEANAAFGDARVYLERYIKPARHIEAQVFGDGRGGALFLGERECSLQRNHQKLLEESPSPALTPELRKQLREAALNGVRAIRYRGAGTLEFLFDDARREFCFLEMNTRLQVEHPVTEMVTRWDLVREQLRIAAGGTLDGVEEPDRHGHALEFRIYAEDPYRGFRPSTGRIEALRLPHAPFTRIDHAIRDGYVVPPYYDPMLGKLIVWGADRPEAIERMKALLQRVRIGGIHTTVPLGVEICAWPAFLAGRCTTDSLEEWLRERATKQRAEPPLKVQLAGIVARAALERAGSKAGAPRAAVAVDSSVESAWLRAARLEGTGRNDGSR